MTTEDLLRVVEARRMYQSGRARELRLAAGLGQADIARTVGASRSAVALWESGQRTPRGAVALRCAGLLAALSAPR